MIISHKHRFIFIHGQKTAGTAIADRLRTVCGPEDVIVQERSMGLRKHDGSARIREFVGAQIWQEYFKFTFERNPWDKMVSLYAMQVDPEHWTRRDVSPLTRFRALLRGKLYGYHAPSFRKWLLRKDRSFLHASLPQYMDSLYFTEGELAVDFIGRFENLQEDFGKITSRLGLDLTLGEANRKSRRRVDPDFDPHTPSYRRYYDDELRKLVEKRYQREIAYFGYEF